MIKGKRKTNIDKNDILSKISMYDIYRFYNGSFKINEVFVNKHRGEKAPSLIIGDKSGELNHKDFGDYNWRGDAFDFVQQIYRCDLKTALALVNKDFNLGLAFSQVESKKSPINWVQPIINKKKYPKFDVVYYPTMNQEGLDYWSKLNQNQEDLSREHIYQPKEIWRNGRKVPVKGLLTFCYYYPEIDRWKIYRPFAPKATDKTPPSEYKWDSNVPFDYIDNLQNINSDCPIGIIAKSRKDRMVLTKALNTNCIVDVQAEDPSCMSIEALNLFNNIEKRYIVSDNDKKGKEFSWWLTKQYGFKHVNVPDKYLDNNPKCTDFADLCYHYGIEKVIDHFKKKNICV